MTSRLTRAGYDLRGRFQLALGTVMNKLGRDLFDPEDFAVVPQTVAVANLPPGFDGYRIAQMSDVHMGHWISPERLYGVVDMINAQRPDLVAITGDFVSYVLEPFADDMRAALRRLDAPDGVYAVLGNHDHWFDPDGVRNVLRSAGVVELENAIHVVQRGTENLYIAGVDDLIAGNPRLDLVLDALPDGSTAVLLAHEPDFADISAETRRFFLQLSGHSHGGQLVLGNGRVAVRGHMFVKYPIGRYQVGNMVQYTNRGIGTHVLRLRINCDPEITVFTLQREGNMRTPSFSRPE